MEIVQIFKALQLYTYAFQLSIHLLYLFLIDDIFTKFLLNPHIYKD